MQNNEAYEAVLAHYGIKGQKWHVRRYQNEDGSYTQLGKERRRVGYEEPEKKEEKKQSNKTDNGESVESKLGKSYKDMSWLEKHNMRKKARHNEAERREKREFNRDKKEAIDSGDISFVSKNISKFSNEEIDDFMTRYAMIQRLNDVSKAKEKSFIDKALVTLDKASKASKSITDIYNNITTAQTNKLARDLKRKELNKQEDDITKKMNLAKLRQENAKATMEEWKSANPLLALKIDDDKDKKDKSDKSDKSNKGNNTNTNSSNKSNKSNDSSNSSDSSDDYSDDNDYKEYKKAEKAAKKAEKKAEKAAKKAEKEEAEREQRRSEREVEEYLNQKYWEEAVQKEREEAEKAEREYRRKRDQENWDRAVQEENRKLLKKNQKEDSENFMKNLSDDDWNNMMFWGDRKRGLASLFNKHKNTSSEWKEKYDYTAKDIDDYTQKMLKKLQNSYSNNSKLYGSAGRNRKSQEPEYNTARDKRWVKDLKKIDYRKIDNWVDEMTKKYMKERGMSRQAAEDKAEDYVTSWITAYEEGRVKAAR